MLTPIKRSHSRLGSVARWSAVGFVAGAVAGATIGLLEYRYLTSDPVDSSARATFVAESLSEAINCATFYSLIGLVLGAVVGVIRGRSSPASPNSQDPSH